MKLRGKVKKEHKTSQGITLIALVVTIVILIILATISVSALFGENGLIKKAQEAREHQSNAVAMEQEEMDQVAAETANLIAAGGNGGGSVVPELPDITPDTPVGTEVKAPDTWTSDKVIAISDGSGNAIPLPDGFYYVSGDRNSGLVISDKQGDTMDATFPNSGNQFVWIPVDSESDLTRTEFGSNGQPTTGLDTTTYTEPNASGYSDGSGTQETADFNTMKTQVLKYGGFYIGRYEAGDKTNGTTLRRKVTTDHEVVVQRGVAPYNYIPWGKSMSDVDTAFVPTDNNADNATTHGAVYLAKNMYTGKEQANSVTSTLCYGSQWDAMCRYIGDSNRTTPRKSTPELTGSVATDISKNIYDIAGNCTEWTFEAAFNDHRLERGGYYDIAYSISDRGGYYPDYAYQGYSFRPSLYVKD